MPQFHPSDDLTSWFAVCFIERYESLDEPDAKTFAFEVIEESEHLDRAEEFLRLSNLVNDTLVDAILNSVDWDDVKERFKTAIEYDDDNDSLPAVIIDGVEHKDFIMECIEAVIANKNK